MASKKTRYFCQINNKNGVVKTFIDNSTLLDIVNNEKDINIQDKEGNNILHLITASNSEQKSI